jgi:murein DD-endopeptidase MepM/ murein hydrolase activator NlpD
MDSNRLIVKRLIRAIMLAGVFTLFLFYLITLAVTFPVAYPEATLRLEQKIITTIREITLPIRIAQLSIREPDKEILMPVHGIRVREIQDSWHDARPDNRIHEGQDIFADKGVPVFSSTNGYILRADRGNLGGNYVYIIGTGGRRYYYAHFDRIAEGIERGQEVTTDTVIGFVGTTGNAENTPPHLHFGVYANSVAIDPLPLLINRPNN